MNVRAYLANGKPVDGVHRSAVGRRLVVRPRLGLPARRAMTPSRRREIPTDMPAEKEAGFVVPASLFPKPMSQIVTTARAAAALGRVPLADPGRRRRLMPPPDVAA